MDDRVGDVLAQRASLDRGAGAGIAVSVLLHASITAAAVYAAMHQTPTQQVSTLNIRFAPMPNVTAPAAKTLPAQPPKPVKIPEPVAEEPKPAPVTAKPVPRTVPLSPFGHSTKKGSEHPVPPPAPPPQAAAPKSGITTSAEVPIGGAGVTGLDGGDFPYTIYIDRMKNLIGTHWFRPQVTAATSVVSFVIDRDGTIRDAKTELSSGNPTYDRAALRAVLETSPLPPLPFNYSGTYLGVHLTFR